MKAAIMAKRQQDRGDKTHNMRTRADDKQQRSGHDGIHSTALLAQEDDDMNNQWNNTVALASGTRDVTGDKRYPKSCGFCGDTSHNIWQCPHMKAARDQFKGVAKSSGTDGSGAGSQR
jgi:hypothetical protein